MNRVRCAVPAEQATAEDVEAIARARIERARVDVLLDHPYFAAALLEIPMRGTSEQEIGQAVVTDGTRIVYRFELVAAIERPKVLQLLLHALAHILLRHPERGESRDWRLWTAACDVAVEDLLASLAGQHGAGHEANSESAERIYERLRSRSEQGEAKEETTPPDDGMLPPQREGGPGESDSNARDAFERVLAGAERPTPGQLDDLRRDFHDRRDERASERVGRGAGRQSTELDAARRTEIAWKALLARFMREPVGREWSFARPNRKHLWRGLYLPGPMEVEGGHFVVAIDTSGSMSDCDLARVLGEIDAIRSMCACELTVLQFDAEIHATAEFTRWNDEDERVGSTKVMRVFGRGGTDLCVPFRWAEAERAKGRRISALIVCTDGFGPLPTEAPVGTPVLFLLTPKHAPPPFGERVVLPERVGAA